MLLGRDEVCLPRKFLYSRDEVPNGQIYFSVKFPQNFSILVGLVPSRVTLRVKPGSHWVAQIPFTTWLARPHSLLIYILSLRMTSFFQGWHSAQMLQLQQWINVLTYRSNDHCEVSFISFSSHVVESTAHVIYCLLGHLIRYNFQMGSVFDYMSGIVSPLDPRISIWWIWICWAVEQYNFPHINCKHRSYIQTFIWFNSKSIRSICIEKKKKERKQQWKN